MTTLTLLMEFFLLIEKVDSESLKAKINKPGSKISHIVIVRDGFPLEEVAVMLTESLNCYEDLNTMIDDGIVRISEGSLNNTPDVKRMMDVIDILPESCKIISLPPVCLIRMYGI